MLLSLHSLYETFISTAILSIAPHSTEHFPIASLTTAVLWKSPLWLHWLISGEESTTGFFPIWIYLPICHFDIWQLSQLSFCRSWVADGSRGSSFHCAAESGSVRSSVYTAVTRWASWEAAAKLRHAKQGRGEKFEVRSAGFAKEEKSIFYCSNAGVWRGENGVKEEKNGNSAEHISQMMQLTSFCSII